LTTIKQRLRLTLPKTIHNGDKHELAKKGFKSATSWTKDTGKQVIDDIGEAGEDAVEFVKDVGDEVGR